MKSINYKTMKWLLLLMVAALLNACSDDSEEPKVPSVHFEAQPCTQGFIEESAENLSGQSTRTGEATWAPEGYYLYNSDGTGKGIAITTLAICVSLGLIIHVVDFDDENNKKMIRTACKVITVLFAAIATFLIVRNDFATVSIYVGTILYIEAAVTGRIGFLSRK